MNLSQNYSTQTGSKTVRQMIQNIGSILYLRTFMTPSYHLRAIVPLVHGMGYLIGAKEGYHKKDYLDVAIKTVVVAYFFYQGFQCYSLGSQAIGLLKQYPILSKNLLNEKNIGHLWEHPLLNYAKQWRGHRAYFSFKEYFYDLGKNFFGYGKGLLKGMNLRFKSGKIRVLDFKLNHVFREKLQAALQELQKIAEGDQKLLLSLRGSDAKNITIEQITTYFNEWNSLGTSYKITIPDLGTIIIGASKEFPTLYNRVQVHVHHSKGIYGFHKLLSIVGLENVFEKSMWVDIERMKLGQLFRVFSPKDATLLERTEEFFILPIDQLKLKMIQLDPKMESVFEKYLPQMELVDIVNGRRRFAIKGLADELRGKGAKALTSVITGTHNDEETLDRVVSILTMGMLSSELRYDGGFAITGLSTVTDFKTGGCDSVFTQLVTESCADYSRLGYGGDVRLEFSLDALETGTYQYHYDAYGIKKSCEEYLNRPDIYSFVEGQVEQPTCGNELMVKERIFPEFITTIIVKTEKMKIELIKKLRESGLVRMGFDGQEWVNRTLLINLIRVNWVI